LVPVNPDASDLDPKWSGDEAVEEEKSSPFAALKALKDNT